MADEEFDDLNSAYESAQQEAAAELPESDPPVETPVETPGVPETQEAPVESPETSTEASTAVRDALSAQGYDVSGFENDESLIPYLSEGWQRAQSAPDQAELNRLKQIELEYYRSQQKTVPETKAATETQPSPKWSPPPMSERSSKMMEGGLVGRTDDGRLGVFNSVSNAFEYDPRYDKELTEVEDYIAWQSKAQRRLTSDPIAALKDAGLLDVIKAELGLDKIEERVAEKVRAERQQETEAKRIQSYWEANRLQYLELNEKGEPKTVLQEGRQVPVLNARGKVYLDLMQDYTDAGIPEGQAHDKAIVRAAQLTPTAAEPAPGPAVKKKAFLDKARDSGKRNGHQSVNRVFPPLSETATEETEPPRKLSDAWLDAEEEARAELHN